MKTLLLLVSLISFSSLGEILSARGMKQVGEISFRPRLLLKTLPRLFTNFSLILGVGCMAVSFFSFLSLLSYADLSYVVPLTAVSYLTNTLGSKLLLHEKISKPRWWGTILVTFGVAIISLPGKFETFLLSVGNSFAAQLLAVLNPESNAFTPLFTGLFIIRIALSILVWAAICYYLISMFAGYLWSRDRQRQRSLGLNFTPPVSILIPVRGVDDGADEIFAGFCRQNYPDYQIVFGCRDADDPAISVIRRLQNNFPDRQIDLVISANEIGHNAKISNLHNIYDKALHDFLIVVDSDIRVTPDYLRRVVAPLQLPRVGMVTCLYRGAAARTFASLLENIGISSNFGPEVMASRALEGVKFALGSTIVMRREIFEKIGGFPAIADYLADDFLLGNFTAAEGYEVVLSDYVVDHISSDDNLPTMIKHQLRWGRATRISRPKGFAGLILTYGIATSLLFLIALGFSNFGWSMVGITMMVRFLTAFYGGVILMRDFNLLKFFWLIPIRDLIGFGIWAASLGGKEIHWRGDRFIMLPNGKIKPVSES